VKTETNVGMFNCYNAHLEGNVVSQTRR